MSQKKKNLPVFSQRIKELRAVKLMPDGRRTTQQDLADALGLLDAQQVKRYEGGSSEPPAERMKAIAQFFGVPVAYLTGETDITDPIAYEMELEQIEDAALTKYEAANRAARARIVNLFDMIGYSLTDHEGTPAYDLQEISGRPVERYHIKAKEGHFAADLSDADMEQLLQRLKATVAVECYMRRENHGSN